MKLSAIIITNNKSKRFEQAVRSIRDIVDEITVIDTGSGDKDSKFARKFTKNVFYVPLQDDDSLVRNYALSRSNGEWILVLDDDEVLSEEARNAVRELTKHRDYDGYWFSRRWYIDDKRYLKHGLFYPDYTMRLFRNSQEFRYINRVHEEVTIPAGRTKQIPVDIYHYDSIHKYLSWKGFRRVDTYVRMLAMMYKEKGYSKTELVWKAISTFFDMFIMGLTRGKGILDGWVGIKAHFFFAWSITKGYLEAI